MSTLRSLMIPRATARRGLLWPLVLAVACIIAASVLVVGSLTQAMRTMVTEALEATDEDLRVSYMRLPLANPEQIDIGNAFLSERFSNGVTVHSPIDSDVATAEWLFEIDPYALDPWRMQGLVAQFTTLADDARAVEGLTPRGISVNTDIAAILQTTASDVFAIAVVAPVPIALIIVTAAIAVVQLSRLLGRVAKPIGGSRRGKWRSGSSGRSCLSASRCRATA